jgi:hypothetical protein
LEGGGQGGGRCQPGAPSKIKITSISDPVSTVSGFRPLSPVILPGNLDQRAAVLTAVKHRVIFFRFDFFKIPVPDPPGLQAFGTRSVPQFILVDGEVAVSATKPFPRLFHKEQSLMSARIHGQEDTGLPSEKQTNNGPGFQSRIRMYSPTGFTPFSSFS